MQALKAKQQEQAKLRDILNSESTEKTIEERVERCRMLQYDQHQQIFAVSYSTIHKAAAENSLAGVKYFLSTGRRGGRVGGDKSKMFRSHTLEEMNKNGMTPLQCAAEKGAMDVLRFLLEQECNIDGISREGNSALMYACKSNQIAAIRFLIEKKAKFTLTNKTGMNAIHFAAQCDSYEAIEAFLLAVRQLSAVTARSAATESEDQVTFEKDSDDHEGTDEGTEELELPYLEKQLIQALNQPSNNKTTPLHIACACGADRTVQTLVQAGVKINLQDSTGDTPLHKAARSSYYQIYRFLLVHGANDEIMNQFRETPADCLVDHPMY